MKMKTCVPGALARGEGMKRAVVALGIWAAAALLPAVSLEAQEKYALVIGNGAYTAITKLKNPVNDANDMKTALEGLGFQVDLLTNAGLVSMESAVGRFKRKLEGSKGAYGLLFYAGHGVQSGGENYLIPVDADIQSESYLRVRAVPVQAVLDELNEAGNALNVVVLDACRDNPFSWRRSGTRGLQVVGSQPANSIIVYATSAGSTAADGEGRNGLFTEQLLKNLKTPGMEVYDIFRHTGSDVEKASGGGQRPAVYSQFYGTAYFGAQPAAQQTRPAPEPQSAAANPTPPVGLEAAVHAAAGAIIPLLPMGATVAVVSSVSHDSDDAEFALEELPYALVNSGGFKVVVRRSLEAALGLEQGFQVSSNSGDDSVVVIESGMLEEADIVITESITGSGATQRLHLTALDVKTAEVVAMVSELYTAQQAQPAPHPQPATAKPAPPAELEAAVHAAASAIIPRLPPRALVAVASIASKDSKAAAFVLDELVYDMVDAGRFRVVDYWGRLKEIGRLSDDVDDDSAMSSGIIIGVDIVITGSITVSGATRRLRLKALDVRNGAIVAMASEAY
jgi:curli biogenesis system outer membrane secretion channel CsgG